MNTQERLRLESVSGDEQLQKFIDLRNQHLRHHPTTLTELHRMDSCMPEGGFLQRWFAYSGDELVGAAVLHNSKWTGKADECSFSIYAVRGEGEVERGSQMLAALEAEARSRNWRVCRSYVPTTLPETIEALEKGGYRVVQENPETELDVAAFSIAAWEPVLLRVRELGVEIHTVTELKQSVADWEERFWRMEMTIMKDVPVPGGFQEQSLEDFKRILAADVPDHDSMLIARHEGEWIGTTQVFKGDANPNHFYTGLTGVLPEWRRKGVATALKALGIEAARKRGAVRVSTDNEENNPMLDLNKQLGFRQLYVTRSYEREI